MTIRTTLIIFVLCLLIGCNIFPTRSSKVFIRDEDYYEIKRQYSPDKTKLLLTYGLNQGATGQGEVGTAILNLDDTLKDIKPFTIAWYIYNECKWLNNDTVLVYLDYLKKMRQNQATRNYYDTTLNVGVQIKYDYRDMIDSSYKMDTLLNQLSPNRKYKLLVYQYINQTVKNNFINISVVNSNDTIPKYGNYFIADTKDDYINNCDWTKSNELLFGTTSSCQYIIENFLVNNRMNIPYKIIVDDNRYKNTFWWTKKNGY